MPKAFSIASWNVKHFGNDMNRVERVIGFLKDQDPDVFAIYEVTGKDVINYMTDEFQRYTFQITEGLQTQEILIGARNNLTTFITQRTEFRSGTTHMRPGQLVSVKMDGIYYSLLFLHLASKTEPRGMGLRDNMLYRAVKFRHQLDKEVGGKHSANYIFLGDLNTMGMEYPFNKNIEPKFELKKWDVRANRYYGMKRLNKSHNKTWSGGSNSSFLPSDLDHVYATTNLKFKHFDKIENKELEPHENYVEVDVRGWVNKDSNQAKDDWINNYSDHSLLYFEVQKVQ